MRSSSPFHFSTSAISLPSSNIIVNVLRRLRARPETAGALIVAVTGYGQAEDRRRAQDAGFDDYLVKPVEFESLRAMLQPDRANA